jgi:hypothetical protein
MYSILMILCENLPYIYQGKMFGPVTFRTNWRCIKSAPGGNCEVSFTVPLTVNPVNPVDPFVPDPANRRRFSAFSARPARRNR